MMQLKTIDTFPVLQLLSIVLLLVTALSLTPGIADEDHNLQQRFEQALNTSYNLYQLSENFFPDSHTSLVCLPFKYNLTCKQEEPCHNKSSNPWNKCKGNGYIASYLWTSFNTHTVPGDMLLHWALTGIRVLGFEWAENCRHSARDAVKLELQVDILPCVEAESDVLKALEQVTRQLQAYAEAQGVPSDAEIRKYKGYATEWHYRTDVSSGDRLVNAIAGIISVFSFLVMLSIGSQVYEALDALINARKNLLYLYFWSFQLLAFMWCWGGLLYILVTLDNELSAFLFYAIYVAMFLDVFIALWIVWRHLDRRFPVPFVFGCCCRGCYSTFVPFVADFLANVFAIWNIFAFLTFLLYSLPSVVLAYYVFPSRSLIRLSFLEFAVIVILIATSLFLYLLEKMCLSCFVKCNRRLVKTQALAEGSHSVNGDKPEASNKDFVEVDLPDMSDYPESKEFKNGTMSAKELVSAVIQFLTSALFLVGIVTLLVAVGVVVFKQTISESKSISGYLTILPTIAVNVTIWFAQKRIFVPDELKSLSHEGATRLEALLKTRKQKQSREVTAKDEEGHSLVGSGEGKNYSTLA